MQVLGLRRCCKRLTKRVIQAPPISPIPSVLEQLFFSRLLLLESQVSLEFYRNITDFRPMNLNELSKVKKVAVIGPECTGKSELAEFLASYYHTQWVPEYARGYLVNLVRPYEQHALLTIAHGQMRLEGKSERGWNTLMLCDTNLYVIKVWSEFKFGNRHPEILRHISTRKYDLYLLTQIDLPWISDPQREHPDRREELYSIYLNEMKKQLVPCVEIKGQGDDRRRMAIDAIDKLLLKK